MEPQTCTLPAPVRNLEARRCARKSASLLARYKSATLGYWQCKRDFLPGLGLCAQTGAKRCKMNPQRCLLQFEETIAAEALIKAASRITSLAERIESGN